MRDYKLFTVGPAQMYRHTLDVRNKIVPYFRTDEFSELMLDNERLLKVAAGASDDAVLIVLTASGSGAMEATVMNCFNKSDKLLIVSGGTFGERFERICDIHQIEYDVIKLGPDEKLEYNHLAMYEGHKYTGMLTQMHETYTGQLYDMNMLHEFCERNGMYLVVDAISSFLCDYYSMSRWNVDATIISSQKGLCLAPGLSFVILSSRMAERITHTDVKSLYFDFNDYLTNMVRGQTPFTPAVGICYELNDMLHCIAAQGVEQRILEVKQRCDYFRNLIKDLPISIPKFPLSNAITPLRFQKDIAKDFFVYLKNEKRIMVNPVGGELGKSSIRVAHIGDLKFQDYDELVDEIKCYFNI